MIVRCWDKEKKTAFFFSLSQHHSHPVHCWAHMSVTDCSERKTPCSFGNKATIFCMFRENWIQCKSTQSQSFKLLFCTSSHVGSEDSLLLCVPNKVQNKIEFILFFTLWTTGTIGQACEARVKAFYCYWVVLLQDTKWENSYFPFTHIKLISLIKANSASLSSYIH